ncbi:SDR family oxidoreductase [Nonomuraea sp. NPDC047897]|uniref:SDR family oxidoreductase n=1 Tax=Nonomuraea sp. NPDC047897 TaxID=3364346 RepID=UPI00371E3AE3
MSILVTGARGGVARHLIGLLREAGQEVRTASSSPGAAEVVCDLADPATFPAALKGVTAAFVYAEPTGAAAFANAAAEAGAEHLVLLSSAAVLDPRADDSPLAKSHLDAERALLAGPVPATLLRPGSFSSNALAWSWPVKAGRPVSLPYPDSHNDPIHEADVADVAFAVLTNPGAPGTPHTLTGPASVTFAEQIDILAAVTGTPIAVEQVSRERWKEEMADYIAGPHADALLDWWEANVDRPAPITGTVERLTGHPARDFTTWAREHADAFRPSA